MNELVSVIITTYRNEELLPRAIDSVLDQTYTSTELIVVDDNEPESVSRKATEHVMESYPEVTYIRHPCNRNGAAARNTGIRAAHGEFIAFLDNDDVYLRDHIAGCVVEMDRHRDCACVLCGVIKVRGGLCWELVPAASGDLSRKLFFSETLLGTGSNLFVRTEAVRRIGGFDESFRRHQDVEFGLRLFSEYRTCAIESVQIIKEMDGFSNVPDFDQSLQIKRHLWETFHDMLEGLTPQEQSEFYAGQYGALLYTACKTGVKGNIDWTVEQLQRYRRITAKERLTVILSRRRLFRWYEELKLSVKRITARVTYKRLIEELEADDRKLLDTVLKQNRMSG